MKFSDMVTESVLLRAVSIIVLGLAMVAALSVATFDFMIGREVPSVVISILGMGLTMAGTIAGINFGLILQTAPKKTTQAGKTVTQPDPPIVVPPTLSPPQAMP